MRKHVLIIGLVLLTLIKGAVWATAVPLFQAPDEPAHFSYVQFTAENGHWPTHPFEHEGNGISQQLEHVLEAVELDEIRFNPLNHQQFAEEGGQGPNEEALLTGKWSARPTQDYASYHYPPLYYPFNLPAYYAFDGDILSQVMAMRGVSIVFFVATLLLLWKGATALLGDKKRALAVTLLIAWFPMFSFISITINNDVLLNLAYAGFLASAFELLETQEKITKKRGLILVSWVILGLFTKTQGYGLLALLALLLFMKWRQGSKRSKFSSKQKIALGALGAAALGLVIRFWFGTYNSRLEAYLSYMKENLGVLGPKIQIYIEEVFESFWGNFGWLDTRLPTIIYTILGLVMLVCTIGFLIDFWKKRKEWDDKIWYSLWVFLFISIIYFLTFLDQEVMTQGAGAFFANQGRYWFIVILPFFALMMRGGLYWIPKKHERLALWGVTMAMVAFHLFTLVGVVVPRYYIGTSEIRTVSLDNRTAILNPGQSMGQSFEVTKDGLAEVRWLVQEPDTDSLLFYFEIRSSSEASTILREGTIDLDSNENVLVMEFEPVQDSSRQSYYLEVEASFSNKESIQIFQSSESYSGGDLYVNNQIRSNDLVFQIYYEQDKNTFHRLDELAERMSQYKPEWVKIPYLYVIWGAFLIVLLGTILSASYALLRPNDNPHISK